MHKSKMRQPAAICILVLLFITVYNLSFVFAKVKVKIKTRDADQAAPAFTPPPAGQAQKDEEPAEESQDETQAAKPEDKEGASAQDKGKGKDAGKEEVKGELKKDLTPPAPAIEIKRLEAEKPSYSIELRNVELGDLFRVIAHDYNLNILVDKDVQGKITASFTNITLDEALEGIAEMSNLVIEKKGNILRVSPNLITKTLILKFIEAKNLIGTQQPQAQSSQPTKASSGQAAGQASGQAAQGQSQTGSIYDLLSEKGKLLLGKQPNSITVIDYPPNVARIEQYLDAVDQKMSIQIFKLKYLKAGELVGNEEPAAPGSAASSYGSQSTGSKTGTGSGK
ncbi:MAG: secretin and TonB N-terminal domain-containing protein [Candidatus Omnitrophica bacterium]|nr:secretin and TonB N-terminal domain-containing protein [Candidatus Omnitrophota bacterium]